MNTKFYFIVRLMVTFCLLGAGCSSKGLPAPLVPLPPSTDPNEIYISSEPSVRTLMPTIQEYTRAIIYGTHAEQLEDLNISYYVPEKDTFRGQLNIEHFRGFSQQYAVICMIDYKQKLCNLSQEEEPIIEFEPNSIKSVPLEISNLQKGMHDLEMIIASIPSSESYRGQLNSFHEAYNMPAMANIFVGKSAIKPPITTVMPERRRLLSGVGDLGFTINRLQNLREPRGIPIWLQEKVQAGTRLHFFLHVHDKQYGQARTNVYMAFLDYKQIPTYVDEEAYMPLYIKRHPGTWQSLHVQIDVPQSRGTYTLLFVERTHAHTMLEGSQMSFFFDEPFTNIQAVELIVEP